MKKIVMIAGLAFLFSLAGCQRYQIFLLNEISEENESEAGAGVEGSEEFKGESFRSEKNQHVLVDRRSGKLFYFRHGELITVDPD
jgi:hypothetical protein